MQFTLIALWQHMGLGARLITATLLLMSLASMAIACERVAVLVASSKQSIAFARRLTVLLADGDFGRAAAAPLDTHVGHLGRVLQTALRVYQSCPQGDDDFTFESVARVLERQAQREVHNMTRGVGILASVASIAPFVGLLGTVIGIVNAFEMMAQTGTGGLSTVSAGIAEALVTTALGLLVAIPCVGAHNGLQAWIDARSVDISEASNELLDLLARYLRVNRAESKEPGTPLRPRRPSTAVGDR